MSGGSSGPDPVGVPLWAVPAGVALGLWSCQPAGSDCSCASPEVVTTLPPDRAAALVSATLEGEACPDVTPTCADAVGTGCARLTFAATAAGSCTLSLAFASGAPAFTATVSFVALPCCAGYFAEPPAAAEIAVPDLADGAAE